jgi:hypothetical protein
MRSRSLVIFSAATISRISSSEKEPRRSSRMACSSITISISLMRGSSRNTSPGSAEVSELSSRTRESNARFMAPSTVRAIETR